MQRGAACAFGIAWVLRGSSALADPLQTWGLPPAKPDEPASHAPAADSAPPPPPASVPAAPAASDGTTGAEPQETPSSPSVGGRYLIEHVEVRGNRTTLERVILRWVPFSKGQSLDVDDKELLLTRFRLLGTGFFRDVQLSLRRGSRRGLVVLVVDVAERNTVVVNDLWLGLSADVEPNGRARPLTAFGGADVSEQNLAGTGVAFGGALALADRQLALRSRVSDPSLFRSSWSAEGQLLYNRARDFFGSRDARVADPQRTSAEDYAIVSYDRFGGKVGVGHELGSVATRAFFDYRLEKIDASLPLAASHRRGLDIEPIGFDLPSGSSVLSTLALTIVHDTRDEPFLPTRGWHLHGLVEGSTAAAGSDFSYTKLVLRASRWFKLPSNHVLRIEGVTGGVFGTAPMFEKFFVGDFTDLRPHRALDLAFDRRAAPNFFGTAISEVRYGDYAARITAEYRIPVYRGSRTVFGVDVFFSAGLYAVATEHDITRPASGYKGFARVPVDATFNAGLRMDTAAGGVAIGLANFVGFVPIRSEGP